MPTRGWVQRAYGGWPRHTSVKDITNGRAPLSSAVAGAAENPGAAAAGSGLPDRVRAATPGGTSHNRNAAATSRTTPQSTRSNRGADSSAPRNLPEKLLGAGPRTPLREAPEQGEVARRAVATPAAAQAERSGGVAVDNAGIAPAGAPCRPDGPARHGWPGGVASVAPRCGRRRSSNGSGDGWADRNARSP